MNTITPIVIAGGGAGGLELAAKLGRKHGPSHVYLIDQSTDHIWKPSLHEVAAGTLDINREGLSYFMLARDCNFTFILGALEGVDQESKQVHVAAAHNAAGQQLFPKRVIDYGSLVIAVGSKSNFFGTPGAAENAITLDATPQAEHFRLKLLHAVMQHEGGLLSQDKVEPLNIVIVGGGATGVELAAELTEAISSLHFYGAHTLTPSRDLSITLVEGADRILVALPPELSSRATKLLLSRGIKVCTNVRVTEVQATQIIDQHGESYAADLCVWAAGIQAPAFKYKDYGSLVAVGHTKGVGSLMGVLSGKSWFVEGLVARTMYMSLHLMHHAAVLGILRTCSLALGRLLLKRSAPRIKLH